VPLIKIVPDIERKAWLAKMRATNPSNGLTADESASIILYSMYSAENEVLLMPATQLEVIGQYQPCADVYMIQLKETEPLYPLRSSV